MINYDDYSEGHAVGWDKGNKEGYTKGYVMAMKEYEDRISILWMNLKTLGVRVDYLEKHIVLKED